MKLKETNNNTHKQTKTEQLNMENNKNTQQKKKTHKNNACFCCVS